MNGAAALRIGIAEGEYHRLSSLRTATEDSVQAARDRLDQLIVEARQTAARDIETTIRPQREAAAARLASMGASVVQRYTMINMLAVDVPAESWVTNGTVYAASDPRLVPHGFVGLVHAPVGTEDEESVEGAGEPPVVRDRDDGSLERGEALLERLGGVQVEVVRRLVEQQQRRPGQFEQQDLQPRLLTSGQGPERLHGADLQLIPGKRGHHPRAISSRLAVHMNRRVVGVLDESEKLLGLLIARRVSGRVIGDWDSQNAHEPVLGIVHVILHAECDNAFHSPAAQPLPARVAFRHFRACEPLVPNHSIISQGSIARHGKALRFLPKC